MTDQRAVERLLATYGPTWNIEQWTTDDPYPLDEATARIWLSVVGPTAFVLARHLATVAAADVDMRAVAVAIGVAPSVAPTSPLIRASARLVCFGLARLVSDGLGVRVRLPELRPHQQARLDRLTAGGR